MGWDSGGWEGMMARQYSFQPDRPGFESCRCFLISGGVTLGKSHGLSNFNWLILNISSILQGWCKGMIHGEHLT